MSTHRRSVMTNMKFVYADQTAKLRGVLKYFQYRNDKDGRDTIQQIGEEINTLIDAEDRPKLLISFANVDHLSSAALGMLIEQVEEVPSKASPTSTPN